MKRIFAGSFLLAALLLPALSAGTVKLKPLTGKITIDGKLTEKVWQRKADVDKFYPFGPVFGTFKGVATKVYLTYDRHYIYVGAYCEEPDMAKLKVTATENDGPVWKDDAIEIFLAPTVKHPSYVQIVINANGVVFDLYRKDPPNTPGDINWNSNAICKTFKGKNFWSLEAAIPLTDLPVNAPEGDWKFHIARSRACKGESYSFIKGIKSFHDSNSFYILSGITIPDLTLTVVEHDPGEIRYGTNRAKVVLKNWSSQKAEAVLSYDKKQITHSIAPKSTQTLYWNWEQPFEQSECKHSTTISSGKKVLRRLNVQRKLGALFGDDRHAVFFIENNKPVNVHLPLNLTGITQKDAQIRWNVRDLKGTIMCSGLTGIRDNRALLRIFWSFIAPGRYKLDLALIVKEKVVATAARDLRLVNSPFQGI